MPHALLLSRPAIGESVPSAFADWLHEGDVADLLRHPLLRQLESGGDTRRLLRRLLVQHHYYSQHFTRFLCALMSNLATPYEVNALAQNLFEEVGADWPDRTSHADLFLRALYSVGAGPGSEPILPETQGLIDAMFAYCRSPHALEGLAALCLGAEAIVPLLYKPVLHAMQDLNFSTEATSFFVIHIAEDAGHAWTMLKLLERRAPPGWPERAHASSIGHDMIGRRMAFLDAIVRLEFQGT